MAYKVKIHFLNISVSSEGSGKSKSEARQLAAKVLIYNLIGPDVKEFLEDSEQSTTPSQILKADSFASNFVGDLQHFCELKKLPIPNYEIVAESGSPHEKVFSVRCTLGEWSQSGEGSSKQRAKHRAAHEMLEFIKAQNISGTAADNNNLGNEKNLEVQDSCVQNDLP